MVSPAVDLLLLDGAAASTGRSLLINAQNVLVKGGTSTNRYGVPIDSIELTERGPGAVSSLRFQLNDPSKEQGLSVGAEIVYWSLATNTQPEFRGWIQAWTTRRLGLGRSYSVKCIGVEAVLDWLIVPSFTAAAGTSLREAIQDAAAQVLGIGVPLRATSVITFGDDVAGSAEFPVAAFQQDLATVTLSADVTLSTPSTLRQVIAELYDAALPYFSEFFGASAFLGAVTVDVDFGLRCFNPAVSPGGYAPITVNAAAGADYSPENLVQEVDASGQVRSVYVQGGNAAGSGVIGDGSGKVGPTAVINDSTILTPEAKRAAAAGYLRDKSFTNRGSFELNGKTHAQLELLGNVRAASILTLTDAETGASGTYPIGQIIKRWHPATQDWAISFGGLPASFPRALRRLTRGTLS